MSAVPRWTSADLWHFPENLHRREIIAGELYVSAHPHWYHQMLCGDFATALDDQNAGQAVFWPGLIFAEDEEVVPDVVWVSQERLARILVDGKLRAAPELIAEVLSPGKRNIARDREAKLELYSRRGVDEYWIADWPSHTIEIYRRAGDRLTTTGTLGPGDTITSPLLPGFALSIDDLFADIPFGLQE